MRIVLDTNVLVSGLLTPFGTCGTVVRMLTSDSVTLCIDSRILLEYEDVLYRERFRIDRRLVWILMEYIIKNSEMCGSKPLGVSLSDPDDNCFLEVSLASHAEYLVTGNSRHFPPELRCGVTVLSPSEFLDVVSERNSTC
jgi:uncharacterized protein